jgi:hypothetical protein
MEILLFIEMYIPSLDSIVVIPRHKNTDRIKEGHMLHAPFATLT